MLLKYSACFLLCSSLATAASLTDSGGDYIMALGRKHYIRRSSGASTPPPLLSPLESPRQNTACSIETQTLTVHVKNENTMTDEIPQKTMGVNTENIAQKTVSTNTDTIIKQMVDINLQTNMKTVSEDKETNTAPLDGSGKHLYTLQDKTTQTQSKELAPYERMMPMSMEPSKSMEFKEDE